MTFKVASFNIWHGLNGDKSIKMDSLEPKGRKFLRLNYQRDLLRDVAADLIMLQEVNPCPRLTTEFAEDLNFDEIHQVDNAGIKILGFGLPKKLFGGISILARKDLKLRLLEAVKLSGPPFSFCSDIISIQMNEHRYCLIGEIDHPSIGRTLCANVHLHHGLELTKSLHQKFDSLKKEGLITNEEYQQMLAVGLAAQARRLFEINTMAAAIERIQTAQAYDGVILGGDLNCTEESLEWQKIIDLGFTDHNFTLNGPHTNFTWNYEKNRANHDLGKSFHFPWQLHRKFDEPATQDVLRQALMENEFRDRRIDYIFSKGKINQGLVTNTLFADKPNKFGLMASDHLGVVTNIKL